MSLADVRSSPRSPTPETCQCDALDAGASVTSDLHKYQVACTCKPASVQYASADDPGPPPPAKTDTPPALPPRPPTSVLAATNRRNNSSVGCSNEPQCRRRKYAWWCCGCGALAAALGGLLAAQHILVRAYTASPHHLETVPAAVPAAMLVLTGVCIMSLARRRNRYSYMIKVVGACCLVCALTCVLVTITTTVIHMNKLQTLKFCEYTKLTRTCTCFSMSPDSQHGASDDDGVRCVFEGVSDCGVVHGALYWCLRGVFALSVSAVLVCIFSCMLAYQLLSHERKKMYWEQLELRCRSLYRAPGGARGGRPGRGGTEGHAQNTCSCCTQCHTSQPAWDFSLQHRFWAPGRIGNLYSPNPGTGRKTSPWSWFPWPRGNSQNSRCQMGGVPQSGDSAYGFCETEPNPNPSQPYDDTYPQNFEQFQRQTANFSQNPANFSQNTGNFSQSTAAFSQNPANFAQTSFQYQEGFEGVSEVQPGVWGPPPPYSPHGRSASRHHLHQDPASATLLHHHHIDHRNSVNVQEVHSCTRNYLHNIQNIDIHRMQDLNVNPDMRLNPELARMNPELARMNPELARMNPELARMNPELARMNPELARMNPELARMNPEMARINPELARMNPELARMNPELARINPEIARINPELSRLNSELNMYPNDQNDICMQEMVNVTQGFSTLRGHLVPYRNCQRLGMSAGNLHREDVNIECLHQKSGSKVSDQSGDSCPKQGKENLGFQNDKHSPIRCSLQESRPSAESEVYFADVSSCCNVSVKADCCMNPNVSALVGTIENHQESSESDTSFTLTRQQRPQPQTSNKRRPRHTDKHKHRHDYNVQHGELPARDCRIERISDARMSERFGDRMSDLIERNERIERMCANEQAVERISDSRDRLNESRSDRMSDRFNDSRIERMSMRGNDRDRSNDSRIDRLNDSRIDRLNESRIDRLNDSRIDRLNDSRIERISDSRFDRGDRERSSEARIDRMNDSRIMNDRLNDSRLDRSDQDRSNDSRIERLNDRANDSRLDRSDRDRSNDSRIDKFNDSRLDRTSDRGNGADRCDRERSNESRIERLNDTRTERIDRFEGRTSDMTSIRAEGAPGGCPRLARGSPQSAARDNNRDTTTDSKEFFTPISPLSPNTEESLLSDDETPETVYSNEPEASKCLGPDSQYEPIKNEVLKTSHHHCYSDTNTMDSGWQSGSEKQVTD